MSYLDVTEREILTLINKTDIELEIPSYLDANEVNEVLEDATILWYSDNDHNLCVLAAWPDKERPFNTMIYFSRFFAINGKTVVSHDATANNMLQGLIQLSKLANKHFE